MGLRDIESRLPPGFRFHPSDEELVCYYLRNKVAEANHQTVPISPATTMVEVDLHAREPWELPEVAKLSADEWYFFSFQDRKYAKGSRTNRASKQGYWKATGKDKMIHEPAVMGGLVVAGMRKTLVFYFGRAPNGRKSGWVMHEFRLDTPCSPPKEDWVLCRVFYKGKGEAGLQSNSYCINGPSRSPPTITLCSPPQRPAAASAADKSGCRRLMISSPPTINDDLQDDQLRDAGSDAQLLDLATLQAADSFLEFEQGVAAVGVGSTSTMDMEIMEMESLATSCGVFRGGDFSTDGVFF